MLAPASQKMCGCEFERKTHYTTVAFPATHKRGANVRPDLGATCRHGWARRRNRRAAWVAPASLGGLWLRTCPPTAGMTRRARSERQTSSPGAPICDRPRNPTRAHATSRSSHRGTRRTRIVRTRTRGNPPSNPLPADRCRGGRAAGNRRVQGARPSVF